MTLNPSSQRHFFLLALLVDTCFLAGCGNVGDPLPPLIQIPAPVSDLAAYQFGKWIKLSWTLPKLNTDGSAATTSAGVEVYRLSADSSQNVIPEKALFVRFALKWKVFEEPDFEAQREGGKLVITDTLSDSETAKIFGATFSYAVKVINKKKQDAGISNIVSVKVLPIPNPPEGLRSTLAEHFIELSWELPTLNTDDSPVKDRVKFNVYRSGNPKIAVGERLTQTPTAGSSFEDESMEFGKTYYYFVRAVIETAAGSIESFDSKKLEVINHDTYPPKPPSEVTAISSGEFISLVWSPNSEPDLSGYLVYRSGQDRDLKRLNENLIVTASTIDKTAQKGQTYFYRVKAVDSHGNESDFSEEVGEKVE